MIGTMAASRGGSKEMRYRIQFLDGSATVIAECRIEAQNAGRAIELLEGVRWPAGAVRMRILDTSGREVDERVKADTH
jgi:hypothetical protein